MLLSQHCDDIFSCVNILNQIILSGLCNIILSVIMSVLPTMWLTIDLSHQGQVVGHLEKGKKQNKELLQPKIHPYRGIVEDLVKGIVHKKILW